MALAKKCDRCGVLYEPYNGVNGISFECISAYGDVDKTEKTIDLCPECMTKIRSIFNGIKFAERK